MKKNLISVLILALVLANLILTAILAFTIIPQTKKSNELIDQVCSAIDLELESGSNITVPIENIDFRTISAEAFVRFSSVRTPLTLNTSGIRCTTTATTTPAVPLVSTQ